MSGASFAENALHFCVQDLAGAHVPGSRLHSILENLRADKSATTLSLVFLREHGLEALHNLASGEVSNDTFREMALIEQIIRLESAAAANLAKEAEAREREIKRQAIDAEIQAEMARSRERVEAARLAREQDPRYIAKAKNQHLRAKYGLDEFIEQQCFERLMDILKRVDAGRRLEQEDFVWLSSVGEEYFSSELRSSYHRLEADFFASEYRKSGDPWNAVNASSHYRKCNRSSQANDLLATVEIEKAPFGKLRSALYTIRGGVSRDLGLWEEAHRFGGEAHALMPRDYRPCTLLGAVYMETGNYGLGQEWYAKAVERGATVDSVDQELRRIFFRSERGKQEEMRAFLLNADTIRYAWANALVGAK